jgi:hypothetical protein
MGKEDLQKQLETLLLRRGECLARQDLQSLQAVQARLRSARTLEAVQARLAGAAALAEGEKRRVLRELFGQSNKLSLQLKDDKVVRVPHELTVALLRTVG